MFNTDLSAEILHARRGYQDTFKILKEKKSTIKITLPARIDQGSHSDLREKSIALQTSES